MKKQMVPLVCVIVLLLSASAGTAAARNGSADAGAPAPAGLAGDVQSFFPVQGKLTNAGGSPLNGDYEITFRLYNVYSGGTALCEDTNTVNVVNGLFNSSVGGNCGSDDINGQQLYLGIQVAGDTEMVPRQFVDAIPYAWSLRPNAVIMGSVSGGPILHIENAEPTGRGLRSYAMSQTGANYGVVAASRSPDGFGGYFYNNGGGVGLRGESNTGVAVRASGSGVIQSTALSYVWISGNGVRPFKQSDSTIIDMNNTGGARVTCGGSVVGNKNVMLPITITGPLYGQNVTVTGLDISYVGDTSFDGITAVLMRRQTGVCSGSACFVNLLADGTDHTCVNDDQPTGCTQHWDITANNILTADSGILYLTIELAFGGTTGWVEIGGARLTLKHE